MKQNQTNLPHHDCHFYWFQGSGQLLPTAPAGHTGRDCPGTPAPLPAQGWGGRTFSTALADLTEELVFWLTVYWKGWCNSSRSKLEPLVVVEAETLSSPGVGYQGNEHVQQALRASFWSTTFWSWPWWNEEAGPEQQGCGGTISSAGHAEVPSATRGPCCLLLSTDTSSPLLFFTTGVKAMMWSLWRWKAAWAMPVTCDGCRLEWEHCAATAPKGLNTSTLWLSLEAPEDLCSLPCVCSCSSGSVNCFWSRSKQHNNRRKREDLTGLPVPDSEPQYWTDITESVQY